MGKKNKKKKNDFKVIFSFNGKDFIINCNIEQKLEEICQTFLTKLKLDKKVGFICKGKILNEELTPKEMLTKFKEKSKILNILVTENINNTQNNEDNKEYFDKINHKYQNNLNFKHTFNIAKVINKLDYIKLVDIFEVYISYKDNIEYLALPNKNNLDIIELINNKKVIQLKGHKLDIFFVKYYINEKNNNEYLLTIEGGNTIFVWDINNNYNIINKTRNTDDHTLFSCLLVFPKNYNDNFVVVPPIDCFDEIGIKIISIETGKMIRNIITEYYPYLVSWYNEKDSQNYIIQLNGEKIIINNLLKDDIFFESTLESYTEYNNVYIYNNNNIDYLCSLLNNGFIQIWDVNNKKMIKHFNTKCPLFNIIEWNNKFIIGCEYKYIDFNNSEYSLRIIDLEKEKVITKIKSYIKCIKKLYHSKYGESLIISDDNYISLWKS